MNALASPRNIKSESLLGSLAAVLFQGALDDSKGQSKLKIPEK